MDDAKMDKDGDLVDYNEVDPEDLNAKRSPELDWTFNDNHEVLSRSDPYVPKPPRGSVEDIQHKLRTLGVRLRKELNRSLLTEPPKMDSPKKTGFTTLGTANTG
jgi:hypothetical protein